MSIDLDFNQNKTEVTKFRLDSSSRTHCINFSSLGHYEKSRITNLGIKLDPCLKPDTHVSAVVTSRFCFFCWGSYLRLSWFSPDITVIHASITSHHDLCNALLSGISQASIAHLQLVQNAAAWLLACTSIQDHITPILAILHISWTPWFHSDIVFRLKLPKVSKVNEWVIQF